MVEDVSLYFHIPFCKKKCPYCHFYVLPDNSDSQELLLQSFKIEWELHQSKLKDKNIVSIYFGGGTPSLLGSHALGTILDWIAVPKDCEITLEVNPELVTLELMRSFALIGINRISLGVQSLHDPTLKMLGRQHSAFKSIEAINNTYNAGIHNITIDLMYEIPGQTFESWSYTLNQLSTLPITHLSLYNLTIEPHTLYYKKRKTLIPLLPPAEVSLNMLQAAVDYLEGIGLKRYEISAFSHPGLESRHNLGYWTARPFIGIGPSAFSYYDKKRLRNICHLKNYAQALQEGKSPIDFEEALSDAHSLHELLAVRLRLLSGVDMRDFPVPKSLYQSLQDKGWLTIEKDRACLTDQGLLFYDSVATEIIL